MADVCGPWTLEDLDQFGDLDSLAFSLDSAVWNTACIYDGSAFTSALATANSVGYRERQAQGEISASATVSNNGYRERISSASISASGVVEINYERIRNSSAAVATDASTSALGGMSYSGYAHMVAGSSSTMQAAANYAGILRSTASCTVSCTGANWGDNWGDVSIGADSWTNVAVGANTWTTVTQGNNTWQPSA